jgi:hypothetical protein
VIGGAFLETSSVEACTYRDVLIEIKEHIKEDSR